MLTSTDFMLSLTLLTLFSPPLCQLMMTVGLLAVVVYLYTVVAFNFFRKFYNKSEDEDEPDMKCDDMMTVRHRSPKETSHVDIFRALPLAHIHFFLLRSVTSSTCTWGSVQAEASGMRSKTRLEMNTSSIEWSLILRSSSSSLLSYWPLFRVRKMFVWLLTDFISLPDDCVVVHCRFDH